MGFAFLEVGLIAYAHGKLSKPESYTKIAIFPKKRPVLLI